MYLRPELVDAHDIYWALIRHKLLARQIKAPYKLSQPADMQASWIDPDLILSQTCGMPYRNSLHGKVQLVGTPDFKIAGCEPGYYRSALVVRKSDKNKTALDFRNSIFAYNSKDSQSGYAAAFNFFEPLGFWFSQMHASGAHAASAQAVAEGVADIAAIDAVTWRLLTRYEKFTEQLHVLDSTEPTPGLPYITSFSNDKQAIFECITTAIEELPSQTRELLGISSLQEINATEYLQVSNPTE